MSGNQQNPDVMCEVFILGPSDLVDGANTAAGGWGRMIRPDQGPSGEP